MTVVNFVLSLRSRRLRDRSRIFAGEAISFIDCLAILMKQDGSQWQKHVGGTF